MDRACILPKEWIVILAIFILKEVYVLFIILWLAFSGWILHKASDKRQ